MAQAYPELRFETRQGTIYLIGLFRLVLEGRQIDAYSIELEFPDNYPLGVPVLREVGGRIPHNVDYHVYEEDGRACLWAPGERWRYWPKGSTLLDFLEGPVKSFLVSQAIHERTGEWEFGQRPHGAEGILEVYKQLLGTDDDEGVLRFLHVLRHRSVKGHWDCPCGSGKRLRSCHRNLVNCLAERIEPWEADAALAILLQSRRAR